MAVGGHCQVCLDSAHACPVTVTPAVIFTPSCVSDTGGLALCPGSGLALQRLWLK